MYWLKKIIFLIFLFQAFSLLAENANEIINKAEDKAKGENMLGTFTMNIVRPDYTRTVKMKNWNKGNEKALIEILAPKKEEGNKTLKIGNELWTYLKNTETTMKLPPSMMLQSWNGSDLTNDDLVRESDLADDYFAKIMFEEKIGNEMCWKIELTPKPDAPVVWGKIYYWVRKVDYLPYIVQYYDEKGKLHRTMKFTDIKELDGRKIPSKWTIINENKDGEYTEFIFNEVEFDAKIPDRIFSFRQLER
jgi:outer membrane lipoprotein-sorting protein